jgi:hypothetical protein
LFAISSVAGPTPATVMPGKLLATSDMAGTLSACLGRRCGDATAVRCADIRRLKYTSRRSHPKSGAAIRCHWWNNAPMPSISLNAGRCC